MRLWAWLSLIGVAIISRLRAQWQARRATTLRHERDSLKAKDETRQRIDSIDTSGDDLDWLLKRSQSGRNMRSNAKKQD